MSEKKLRSKLRGIGPGEIQRLLMTKKSTELTKSFKISAIIDVIFYSLIGVIALSALALDPTIEAGKAYFYIVDNTLMTGIKGLAVVGLLAAIMSTADSYLNVASLSLVNDTIKPLYKNLNPKIELPLARILSVLVGVGSIIMATSFESLIEITLAALDYWGPIVAVPLLLGILGFRASERTFFISAGVGVFTYVVLKYTTGTNVFGISYALLPSMLANAMTFMLCRYFLDKKGIAPNDDEPSSGGGRKKDSTSFLGSVGEKATTTVQSLSVKNITLSNLNNTITRQIDQHGAQMISFGVFGCIAYSVPFFMSDVSTSDINTSYIVTRLVALSLCFMLLMKDYWPGALKKYQPTFWYLTLTFCLPFFISYMMLSSGFSNIWLVNMALGLFLLSVLVTWKSFIVLLSLGSMVGAYLCITICGGFHASITTHTYVLGFYIALFSILIGVIFSRNKEFIQLKILEAKEKINKQLESKVQQRTKHLEEALSIKKRFLNNMSHGVRIPLQGILGISDGLKAGWNNYTDEQKREYNDQIVQSGDRLMSLLSNLLDLSKLDSGKMTYDLRAGDLECLVKEIVEEYSSKKVAFKSKLERQEKLSFDRIRITQVLENLISNAIKFGNNKEIIVIVDKTKFCYKDESKEGISITVTDKGVGIPRAELSRIFAPFEESARTKTMAGGTGLGLSIAREITKAHKGIIFAESNKKGSSFTFILPMINQRLQAVDEGKQLNIMLVDDERLVLDAGSMMLSNLGQHVITASSGKEALSKLKQSSKIDLILLDLMMPDMYGLNVLEKIKSDKKYRNIPIIIQTGSDDGKEMKKAYKLGAMTCLHKPFNSKKLMEIIDSIRPTIL